MIQLSSEHIKLQAHAANKEEAIKLVASMLIDNGNMSPAYADSMLGREQISNTYLGNGIAIPHGMIEDRELIIQTGIVVAQFPDGVVWSGNDKAHIVVGIAARTDEHIEILTNLTHVLDSAETMQRLITTKNAMDIVACLSSSDGLATATSSEIIDEALFKVIDVELAGDAGLHARPASAFVELAKRFESEVRVSHGDKIANGKSLISLLKLGANKRVKIRIMVRGRDEDSALQALASAVRLGLEDDAESGHALPVVTATASLKLLSPAIEGIASSIGIAIGPIHHFKRKDIVVSETAQDPLQENASLNLAVQQAKLALQQLHDEVQARSGAAHAAIFKAHQEFLDDPDLIEMALLKIASGYSAAWAWQCSYEARASEVSQMEDSLLRERANDILDVGRRVLSLLTHESDDGAQNFEQAVILVAEDLSPSDTAKLDPKKVLGICTALGGSTSHTAIIARSLDIPAIVGLGAQLQSVSQGAMAILDGNAGHLYVNPSQEDLTIAQQAQAQEAAIRAAENLACYEPALTTDGHRIDVVANIGAASEAMPAVNAGAEGVGLLRTEFLFLQRSTPPSEQEQYQSYCEMTKALNGLPLIIRTLDIGGDKEVPYLALPEEQNPFLGVRGIRLCLLRPDLFKPQLRAIYRAAATGPVKIMFPMIATLEELLAAKAIAEEVRVEMNAVHVEIGMMMEVPSAVLMANEFAQHVDFFSVGTNDLTQYVLAMDRMHPTLSKQADALHPAVLRMIDMTVKAAKANGIWVGVCGGIAGDAKGAVILTGLGVSELSMSVSSVATVKAKLRKVSYAECVALAQRALACATATEVRSL
jgi:multiphosphoryl transfer protein